VPQEGGRTKDLYTPKSSHLTMKHKREVFSRRPPFQGGFIGDAFPGLKPRLRKAYVAASSKTMKSSQVGARHSGATAAWAVLLSPFGRGIAADR
jgi:hypothetical protein